MKISGKTSLIKSFILRNNITGEGNDENTDDGLSQNSVVLIDELQKNIEAERELEERKEQKIAKLNFSRVTRYPDIIIEAGSESCNSSPDIINQTRPKICSRISNKSSPIVTKSPELHEKRHLKLDQKKVTENLQTYKNLFKQVDKRSSDQVYSQTDQLKLQEFYDKFDF